MVRFVPLIVLLVWAAIEDVRVRRIRNWLSYTLILSGLAMALMPQASLSIGKSAGGLAIGFGLCLVLYGLSAVKAGDVKLLAGVGAWLGPTPILAVFAVAAIAGMVIALFMATRQGRLRGLLRDGLILGAGLAHGAPSSVPGFSDGGLARFDQSPAPGPGQTGDPSAEQAKRMRGLPFAVAILVGTVVVLMSKLILSALQGR
jgi:Flp pilus assembly protein protease CpaA